MPQPPRPGSRPLRPATPPGDGDVMDFLDERPAARTTPTSPLGTTRSAPLPAARPPASGPLRRPAPSLEERAEAGLKEFRAAEMVGMAKLPAPQREAYTRLTKLLASQPLARLGLSYLAVTGQLAGPSRNSEGKDLLTALEEASVAPLAPAIPRERLLAELIQDLASPSIVAQEKRGTRGVTTAQLRLLQRMPAEYVRLVMGLASPEGRVKLAGGTLWTRAPGSEQEDKDRAIPSRLLQGALLRLRPPAGPRGTGPMGTGPMGAGPRGVAPGRPPGGRP